MIFFISSLSFDITYFTYNSDAVMFILHYDTQTKFKNFQGQK